MNNILCSIEKPHSIVEAIYYVFTQNRIPLLERYISYASTPSFLTPYTFRTVVSLSCFCARGIL